MSVKISPINSDHVVQRVQPLSLFLTGLCKLGILQTEFRLFSCRTSVLILWSLLPLSSIVSLFYPSEENSDLIVTYSGYACTLLLILWDAMIPSCLVYFFYYNPAVAAQVSYLPKPRKYRLFLTTAFVGVLYGGVFSYFIIEHTSEPNLESFILMFNFMMLIGVIYDVALKFCFVKVVGSVVERFHRDSRHQLLALSPRASQLHSSCDSFQLVTRRSKEILNEYRKIKQGLGPILLLTITTNMTIVILIIFLILRDPTTIALNVANFIFALNSIFILVYVILISDDAFEALSQVAEITR